MVMLIAALLLSVLVGVSLGVLGGGGSILTVPILRYVLDLEAHRAIAVSLLVVGTTSAAALVPHAIRGRVRWTTGIIFGIAGMVGAYAAGRVAHFVPAPILLLAFGLMMFVTAVAMLRERHPSKALGRPSRANERKGSRVALVIAEGLVVGAVTGLVGAGGGFLVVPALVLLGGLGMDVAVGTSLVVITLKSFAGFAGFLGHTVIDWPIAMAVTASAIAGSIGGGMLASKVSPASLRVGFGWFVVAMAFFLLAQELPALLGRVASPALALAVAALGTTVTFLIRRQFGSAPPPAEKTSGQGSDAADLRLVENCRGTRRFSRSVDQPSEASDGRGGTERPLRPKAALGETPVRWQASAERPDHRTNRHGL